MGILGLSERMLGWVIVLGRVIADVCSVLRWNGNIIDNGG